MKTPNVTLDLFDEDYLKESKPILENFLQKRLSLGQVEEIIINLLELEKIVRMLNKMTK